MAYDLTISEIQSITDVEVAFSTTRLLPDWSDIPADFKAGNSYTTLVKAILFNTPLPAGEVEIVDGVTPEQLNRLVRSHLGSFSTKHEHKVAGVGFMMSKASTLILLQGAES